MKRIKIEPIYYLLMILAIIIVIYGSLNFKTDDLTIGHDNVTFYNENWEYTDSNGNTELVSLPGDIEDVKVGESYAITNTLPNDMSTDMTIAFKSTDQIVKVTVDGELIYSYGDDIDCGFYTTPGSGWHFVDIDSTYAGSNISLEFTSLYNVSLGNIGNILYGTKYACVTYFFTRNCIGLFICLLTVIFSTVLIITYFIIKQYNKHIKALLNIGLFAITVSIWSVIETRMLQFVFGNQSVISMITFLSLMLCPIPMILFVRELFLPDKDNLCKVLCALNVANIVISIGLQLTGILDFMHTVVITHGIIAISVFSLYASGVKKYLKRRDKDTKFFLVSAGIFSISILIDLLRFYLGYVGDYSYFFRFGLILYIYILGVYALKKTIPLLRLGIEANSIRQMAYEDVLTSCKNRAYFEEKLSDQTILESEESICITTFNMDNLKNINDRYGHSAGDYIIISTAGILKEIYDSITPVIRIYSDQFGVITYGLSENKVKALIAEVENSVAFFNENDTYTLNLSIGYSFYDKEYDNNLRDVLEKAVYNTYTKKI